MRFYPVQSDTIIFFPIKRKLKQIKRDVFSLLKKEIVYKNMRTKVCDIFHELLHSYAKIVINS